MSRFTISQAARGHTPLFIGLAGASGSGKSYSAGRLATGIQRVVGGDIGWIDTEANRALHYADKFNFKHLPFSPPFSPDDYWDAINVCISNGCKTVIIDSMSHEHEGPGGVLEMHEAEVQRISKAWNCSQETAGFPAWAEPKGKRRRLINNILQVQVNLILCFRAKRKVKMVKNERGKNVPTDQGWMPIAGDEYAYEMTALGVLTPGCNGVPDWLTQDPGSEMVTKRPAQFQGILQDNAQLTEEMGEAMARWSSGAVKAKSEPPPKPLSEAADNLLGMLANCGTLDLLEKIAADVKGYNLASDELKLVRNAYSSRKKELGTL